MYLITIVLICVSLACFCWVSDRSKKPFFKWLGKIIPPLFLLSFIWIPFDFFTAILWLFAGGAMLYSAIALWIKLYKGFLSWRAKDTIGIASFVQDISRPTLTVICFFVAQNVVQMSVYSANAKAIELALATKKQVMKTGSCSTEKPQWATNNDHFADPSYSMHYGKYGTKYNISYTCYSEQQVYQ